MRFIRVRPALQNPPSLHHLLPALVALAMVTSAARADEPPTQKPAPKDAAILEIAAPPGTKITIDGKDATGQREFLVDLGRESQRECTVDARFPDGSRTKQAVHVQGGWRVPLFLRPTADHRELLIPQIAHGGPVYSVAFSPDGRQALTGSLDRSAALWDVETGERIRTFVGHSGYVYSVCFSPNVREILTGSDDGTAILWNVRNGERVRTVNAHSSGVFATAFRSGGNEFITRSTDGTAIIWNSRTGEKVRSFGQKVENSNSVHFSSDGALVFIDSADKPAVLWSDSHGESALTLEGRKALVRPLAFSPDGALMVAQTWDKETPFLSQNSDAIFAQLREGALWNLATGKIAATLSGHTNNIDCAAFLPDGRQVVTGSYDNTAILWDAQNGKKIRSFSGHSAVIESVACSPDGQRLLTGSGDESAILWDIQTGKKLHVFVERANGSRHDVADDGRQQETLWNIAAGGKVRTCAFSKNAIGAITCSADGMRVVTRASGAWRKAQSAAERTATLWDVETGKILREFEAPGNGVGVVEFSPDCKQLLLGAYGRSLDLWDTWTGKKLRSFAPSEPGAEVAQSAAFSSDGMKVLACYRNVHYSGSSFMHVGKDGKPIPWIAGAAIIWDAQTGERLLTLGKGQDGDAFRCAAFNHDGRQALTASESGRTILWNTQTGEKIRTIENAGEYTTISEPHPSTGELSFAPDGRQILFGTYHGKEAAVVFDTQTGRRLRVHSGSPAGFNSDGSQYMINAEDGSKLLLSAATGEELARLITIDTGKDWLVTTPDGIFDCSPDGRKYVRFRAPADPMKVLPVEQGFQSYYHPNLLADILTGHAVAPPDWKQDRTK